MPDPYGLTKIDAGLYRHKSGWLLLKTDVHEGPRGGELVRWEDAQLGRHGGLEVLGNVFETRLRDAVPALERAIQRGDMPSHTPELASSPVAESRWLRAEAAGSLDCA